MGRNGATVQAYTMCKTLRHKRLIFVPKGWCHIS